MSRCTRHDNDKVNYWGTLWNKGKHKLVKVDLRFEDSTYEERDPSPQSFDTISGKGRHEKSYRSEHKRVLAETRYITSLEGRSLVT